MVTELGFQCYNFFTPLQALMASREPGGDAFTPAPGGWDSHPHGYLVIMVKMACASSSKPVTLTFLGISHFSQNESHPQLYLIAKSNQQSAI
jgi:hypothetical protein